MPRAITAQSGWPGGEWSPRLIGRFDLEQYNRALALCENAIPLPQGVVMRRPPTRLLVSLSSVPDAVRLIPLVVDNETVALIVMLPESFLVYDLNGGLLAGPVSHPYTAAELSTISWAQDVDVVYIVCPTRPPYKITRVTPTSYTIAPVVFLNARAPLAPVNPDNDKIATLSGSWPSLTVTMSAATFIAADVGRTFFSRDLANKRAIYATITSVVSPTEATLNGEFQQGGPSLPAPGPDWALGLFSDTKGCHAVCFHEARLWYGGFTEEPDLIVGSVSNSFDNFETVSPDPTVSAASNADKSVARRVDGAPVVWLISAANNLVVGAARQENIVVPGVTGVLTPVEAAVRGVTERGSEKYCQPVKIDQSIFFVERGGRRIRQVKFAGGGADDFETLDASILASHFTARRIYRLAYQQAPFSILWALDRQDNLYGWTIEGEQQVLGAHQHMLGGAYFGRAPRVMDFACLPVIREGASSDALCLVVKRVVDGTEVATIESLEFPAEFDRHRAGETPPEQMIYAAERVPFVDCYRRESTNTRYDIVDAYPVAGGEIEFKYSPSSPHPVLGEQIVFRGLAWQSGNKVIDYRKVNRDMFTVADLDTSSRTFRIKAIGATANVKFSDYDLSDTDTTLFIDNDGVFPQASKVVSSLPSVAGAPGDNRTYVADTVYKLSIPATELVSLVYVGFRYKTRVRTMPMKLAQGLTPTDVGEPVIPTRVTLRLRAAVGGEVRVGGGPLAEVLVMGTTDDLMDGPPIPAYKDFTIPVNGSWGDDGSIVIETDSPFPFELLGLYTNLKTNPR